MSGIYLSPTQWQCLILLAFAAGVCVGILVNEWSRNRESEPGNAGQDGGV